MIVVGRNQTEKDRAELHTMVARHGITDVLLMLADIWADRKTPRGEQLHAILVKAREDAMKRPNEFSKAFEERLTWKPGDLVMLDPETLEPIDIYNQDKVSEAVQEAYEEHIAKQKPGEET